MQLSVFRLPDSNYRIHLFSSFWYPSKRKEVLMCLLMLFAGFLLEAQPVDTERDLLVLSDRGKTWLRFNNSTQALDIHLLNEAEKLFDARDRISSGLYSLDQVESRKNEVRRTLEELVGSEHGDTPLNARITGTLEKDGYKVELILFESVPGFFVTGSLFIPDSVEKPAPTILFCSGHSAQAFRRDIYQLPLLNLVKKGFIVFAIDPLGQGERMQYMDHETGESLIGSSTKEHSYPMPQSALIGKSVAEYFIRDGIRAVDYLLTRSEVDPDRIGLHGLSGGGTQTAYISAMDDRIKAAAPAGYITSYRRLFESIGVQDGEQNFYRGIVSGIDHPELLLAGAPKPVLLMATTRDFFSIEGTRETFDEMRRIYAMYGKEDDIHIVEGDKGHGYIENTREAMYAFFQKYLDNPGNSAEEEVEFIPEEEIRVTTSGQLDNSVGSKTVYDLVKERFAPYGDHLRSQRDNPDVRQEKIIKDARDLSGYITPEGKGYPFFMGRVQREGYSIEKYFIDGEGDYPIPFLIFYPSDRSKETIMYLHPEGKMTEAMHGQKIEKLVKQGYTVVAPDLLGLGELVADRLRGDAVMDGISYNAWFSGMAIGRSILGIRSGDIARLTRVLKSDFDFERIHGIAEEELASVLLHSAVFEDQFSSLTFVKPLASFQSLIDSRFYDKKYVLSLVPGALLSYDLPDLGACLSPVKCLIVQPQSGNGDDLSKNEVEKILAPVTDAYHRQGQSDNLTIIEKMEEEDFVKTIDSFLR